MLECCCVGVVFLPLYPFLSACVSMAVYGFSYNYVLYLFWVLKKPHYAVNVVFYAACHCF